MVVRGAGVVWGQVNCGGAVVLIVEGGVMIWESVCGGLHELQAFGRVIRRWALLRVVRVEEWDRKGRYGEVW